MRCSYGSRRTRRNNRLKRFRLWSQRMPCDVQLRQINLVVWRRCAIYVTTTMLQTLQPAQLAYPSFDLLAFTHQEYLYKRRAVVDRPTVTSNAAYFFVFLAFSAFHSPLPRPIPTPRRRKAVNRLPRSLSRRKTAQQSEKSAPRNHFILFACFGM